MPERWGLISGLSVLIWNVLVYTLVVTLRRRGPLRAARIAHRGQRPPRIRTAPGRGEAHREPPHHRRAHLKDSGARSPCLARAAKSHRDDHGAAGTVPSDNNRSRSGGPRTPLMVAEDVWRVAS